MASSQVRIMILLMIKNESKIIKRSIDSTLPFADAIFIEDTCSTDDTMDVIKEHFKTLKVPAHVTQHPWKNFGASRSHSFQSAQEFCKTLGWNPEKTYVFAMDADMNLIVSPSFNKETLTVAGYQVMQKNASMEYVNMRLMRLSDAWTCIGATHEYWNTPGGLSTGEVAKELIYIDDKNDGGCKGDKYTRDRDLLEEELITKPDNDRTHFYLAQTYKCLGQYEKAIEFYKKRIKLGGWYEEVWFSHYMIAQLYLSLNNAEKGELWVQKAQKFNGYRAEALYILVKYYRLQSTSQWKAMHYLREAKKIQKPRVSLFSECEIYDYLLDYEHTVLQYYVNPVRKEGNISTIQYLLKPEPPNTENVFQNLEFYVEPLPKYYERTALNAPDFGEFKASSPSVIKLSDGQHLMNIRYVNYETRKDGSYHPRDTEGQVRTRNAYFKYTPPFQAVSELTFIDDAIPSDLVQHPTRVHGFEDVRLVPFKDKLYYTSTSAEFSPQVRVIFGEYDMATNKFVNNRVLQPTAQTPCEKNWLAVTHLPELQFIYGWHPFQAGPLPTDSSNKLKITTTYNTPPYFSKLRGSANTYLHKGRLYALVHSVKYATPRKYFHHIVQLDVETLKPLAITQAFAFDEIGIEYCLSMLMDNDTVTFTYSQFDSNPKCITISQSEFTFITF